MSDVSARQGSGTNKVVVGCLIAVVVLIVLLVLAGWWAYRSFRTFAADTIHQGMVLTVRDSELSEEQQGAIIVHLDRLHADFKAGKISFEQMVHVMEKLGEGPLTKLAPLWGAQTMYLDRAALAEEDYANARRQMQRFMRGVYDEKITEEQAEAVMAPLMEPDPENPGEERMKPRLTKEELDAFIASLKQHADDANIAEDPPEIDIAADIGKAIDAALAEPVED